MSASLVEATGITRHYLLGRGRLLRALDGVSKARCVNEGGEIVTVRCSFDAKGEDHDGASIVERAVAALVTGGLAVREVRPAGGSLEDVFAELTRGGEAS